MKPKLLYFITEDWFFCSHFIERAKAARDAGYEVVVVTRVDKHGELITSAGMRLVSIPLERRSINPLRELALLLRLYKIYHKEQPTIVHHVASKPIFYGSLIARTLKKLAVVNAPVGLGYAFSSMDSTAGLMRQFMQVAYKFLLNPVNARVIFENSSDLDLFVQRRYVRRQDVVLIKGAGINLVSFQPSVKTDGPVLVVLVARMLRDKGVLEFVNAANQVYASGVNARFALVGEPDPGNPASIQIATLQQWDGNNGIEWWGWRDDIAAVLAQAHIVCLPSYREGLPKSLLEAAACGLPIVTTDAIGCRDVVTEGVNGYLVPIRDSESLANALIKLIINPELRAEMGRQGRMRAERDFSSERVIQETLKVYGDLLRLRV